MGWKEEAELRLGVRFGEIGSFPVANFPAHRAQLSLFSSFSLPFLIWPFSLSSHFPFPFLLFLETKQIEPQERKENGFSFFFPTQNLWKVFLNVLHLRSPIRGWGGGQTKNTGSKYDIRELRLPLQYTVRLSISGGFLSPGVYFCQTEVSDDCSYALAV